MAQAGMLSELLRYMKTRKKVWLVPILLILLMIGALIAFVEASAIAPFVYTLF